MPLIENLFQRRNLGLLLDVVVFCLNVLLITVATRLFATLARRASDSIVSLVATGLFCLSLAFLQPLGAILKRRRARAQRAPALDLESYAVVLGIGYFVSQLLFLLSRSLLALDAVRVATGTDYSDSLFAVLFLGIPAVAIVNTTMTLFYFRTPTHAPLIAFLDSPRAEGYGDVLLFLNMICFQMLWGYLVSQLPKDYSGWAERLFILGFTALLIYFPPRLFYLVEEGNRPRVWLTMFVSNTPLILHVVFAKSSTALTTW
jgi:hypothetical protein